jgi:hypothetical protein
MHNIAHGNDRRFDNDIGLRAGDSEWSFRGHRLFYDETLSGGLSSYRFSSSAWDSLFERRRHLPPHLNGKDDSGRKKQSANGYMSHG